MAATGALTIPLAGEMFVGDDPSVCKVLKVTVGVDSGDVTGLDTTAAGAIVNIPANTLVYKVHEYVVTAWSAGSTIAVGDCDTAGQFISAASSTTAATFKAETGLHVAQYYDTPSALTVTLANTGAGNTVGKSDFYIYYHLAGQTSRY